MTRTEILNLSSSSSIIILLVDDVDVGDLVFGGFLLLLLVLGV